MSLYHNLVRPLLFRVDPERMHHLSVEACHYLGIVPGISACARSLFETTDPRLQTSAAGIHFRNPIGLAAGWDKSGRAIRILDSLGLGFIEIGSISASPSTGNPKPRLFRIPSEEAIFVNYGLPNEGSARVANRLASYRPRNPLGINLVKTNFGPQSNPCSEEEILDDYEQSTYRLHPYADYLVYNLSCPNTHDGKDFFTRRGTIARLLERISAVPVQCPIILKIAPTDDPKEHDRILTECDAFPSVRGFCFNLPTGKPDTLRFKASSDLYMHLPGAVSGKPVEVLINRCISSLYLRMDQKRYVIIGTGGVFSAEDAYRKIRLGASLVQVYTGLVYNGPRLIPRLCCDLARLLKRDGFQSPNEAVGAP
jgi:dihydroorotate dehydrogenase (fumarate)/dihydroorotate dehydrogenase